MAFMQPQITKDVWLCVDGPCGTEWLASMLWDREYVENLLDHEDHNGLYGYLADYLENNRIDSVEVVEGYGARLSAPGYMDRTEWTVFDTEKEAKAHLCEMYDLCPVCGEDIHDELEWDHNPACRFHHVKLPV